ncbi:hypothetical protein [Microbacterium sp.]|uniref:hypothetical protein n=1 Tax=Microbacterium sp. TaxID=51671 RepID=UPI003C718066
MLGGELATVLVPFGHEDRSIRITEHSKPSPRRYPDTVGVEVARALLGRSDAAIIEGHYAKRPDLIVEVAADALDKVLAGIDA